MDNLRTILENYLLIAVLVQTFSLLFIAFDPRGPVPTSRRVFWGFGVLVAGPVALGLYFWRGRNPAA